jgi:hypothetical protein
MMMHLVRTCTTPVQLAFRASSAMCAQISDPPAHLPGLALPCRQEPIVGYMGPNHDYPAGQQGHGGYMGMQQQQPPAQQQYRQQPSGARLKVMRCVQLKAPESKRALLDFGLGVGVDLDRQVRLRKMLLGGLQNWSCFVCAGSALLHPVRFLTCSPQSKAVTVLRRARSVSPAQGSCTPTTVKGGWIAWCATAKTGSRSSPKRPAAWYKTKRPDHY